MAACRHEADGSFIRVEEGRLLRDVRHDVGQARRNAPGWRSRSRPDFSGADRPLHCRLRRLSTSHRDHRAGTRGRVHVPHYVDELLHGG